MKKKSLAFNFAFFVFIKVVFGLDKDDPFSRQDCFIPLVLDCPVSQALSSLSSHHISKKDKAEF
jgi:hypothetical protein